MGKAISKDEPEPGLLGVVLAGGYSRRMGRDKALISVDGIPMYQNAGHLLVPFCQRVYISCRPEQRDHLHGFPLVIDKFPSKGPLTGLLSAFLEHPEVAWMTIPVDMPRLTTTILEKYLVRQRDPSMDATVIYDVNNRFPQPLLGIYEPTSRLVMLRNLNAGQYSFRKLLEDLRVNLVEFHDSQNQLANYNLPGDWSR